MTNQNKDYTKKPYPKYESHCCGAPVEIKDGQKVKYYCEDCLAGRA